MSSHFADVGDFHDRFGLPEVSEVEGDSLNAGPTDVDRTTLLFRRNFMQEELLEFTEGMDECDHAKMADALVDLVYVALGTAHYLGLPWQELWDEVHRANMEKVRAAPDGSNSKRGTGLDVVKPEGWRPPDIQRVLKDYNWYA